MEGKRPGGFALEANDGRVRRRWNDERRERMSAIHRRRMGAPEGHSTVYGVFVPHQHAKVIRHFAHRLKCKFGAEVSNSFIAHHKSNEWREMPELDAIYQQVLEVAANRKAIRKLELEVWLNR